MHQHFTETLPHTDTHQYRHVWKFGTLLPIDMHLVKLLFPKSLILDLFVVQIRYIYVGF